MRNTPSLLLALGALLYALPVSAVKEPTPPPKTTEGRLATRDGKKVVDVPLKHTEVHIRVTGHLAEVEVEQVFQNPYKKKIEALYLFPLPTRAAINDMEITSSGKTIKGELFDKETAKLLFLRAKQKGLVAAMLTQKRPNLFVQRVANIEPGAEVAVKLRYVETLSYEEGGYEVVFPMVAGPRYLPKSAKESADAAELQSAVLPPDLRSSHEISLSVEIDAGLPLIEVSSPSHQIEEAKDKEPTRARLSLAKGDTIPNKDFILRYKVAGDAPRFALLAHKEADKEGSFYLLAQPPAAASAEEITPRELIFVLDTSSSMAGAPLQKAKELIRTSLRKMQPDDTFQIVCFDAAASALGPEMLANDPTNLKYSLEWLDALSAGGATEMMTGLSAALSFPHDPLRLRMLVFLTDGYIGNEDEVLRLVSEEMEEARLFSFGVGSAVNRYLLEEMAKMGRGVAAVIRPDEDTDKAVARFYRRIDAPLLTDISIDWGGLSVSEVVPRDIPDLFLGQPLVLSGHYGEGGSGTVTVRAKQAGREVSFPVEIKLPEEEESPAVASVWARARISELGRKEIKEERPELREEILALSLKHRLLTKYTAFLAIDTSQITKGGAAETVPVPVEVPDRVLSYEIYGGVAGGAAYGASSYGSGAMMRDVEPFYGGGVEGAPEKDKDKDKDKDKKKDILEDKRYTPFIQNKKLDIEK